MKKGILFLQIYGGGEISGGTEVYLKNLLTRLNKEVKKKSIIIATFNKKGSIFSKFAIVEDSYLTRFLENWEMVKLMYRFSIFGLLSYIWGVYWLYKLSCKIINKNRINVIYSNGGILTALTAYFLYQKYEIPYILHFHGLFNFKDLMSNKLSLRSLILKKIVRKALASALKIIANSDEVADDINVIKGLNEKIEVVHCFVDTNLFYPQNQTLSRKKLHIPLNNFVLLSSNRLDKDKGIDFLLESIPYIKNKFMTFIFIGNGNLKSNLKNIAEHDNRVIYLDPIKNNLLPKYLNCADIVWGPASVHYIGLSLIEALACGKPIISLDTPLPADNDYGEKVDPNTLPRTIGYLIEKKRSSFVSLIENIAINKTVLKNKRKDCIDFYNNEYGERYSKKIIEIIYNIVRN